MRVDAIRIALGEPLCACNRLARDADAPSSLTRGYE